MPAVIPTSAEDQQAAANASDDLAVRINASHVRKKFCRDLRRSLLYGAHDVLNAMLLRPPDAGKLREHEFWAVDGVSFQLRAGDALGLLGMNGAGKSTLLKLLTGQRSLSSGSVMTRGRIVALTELGLGFNPVLSGRENAYVNAAVHGFSRRRFDALIDTIIDFAGLREFIDSAVQTYSTGMKARLGFSVATHLNPDILIVDEVLAVGDLDFRRKAVQHIQQYIRNGGTLIFVAHDPYLIQSICNRCIILDRGKLLFDGLAIDGVNYHFKLGHERQLDSANEASGRVFGDSLKDFDISPTQPDSVTPDDDYTDGLSDARPILVDSIEVTAESDGPLRTGNPARVIIRLRSLITADITWGFSISTSNLQTNIASCARGLDGDPSHIHPGRNTLVCRFPALALRPGTYSIKGGVGDPVSLAAYSLRGYNDAPAFFTVSEAHSTRTSNYESTMNSLVSFTTQWLS